MPNPYVIIGAIVFWIASIFGATIYERSVRDTYWQGQIDKNRAEAASLALTNYSKKQGEINALLKDQLDKQIAIGDTLRVQLKQLQNRPSRLANPAAGANCSGATGAQLSREDGEFLAGEASRADSIRDGLSVCYATLDVLQPKKDE